MLKVSSGNSMMLEKHHATPGTFERYQLCRTLLDSYQNFNVTATYNVSITPEQISNALRNLMFKYSVFTLNGFRTGEPKDDKVQDCKNYFFRPAKVIKFRDVVFFRDLENPLNEIDLQSISNERIPLNCERPMWRLFVQQYKNVQYITICFNHTLFDGNTGPAFHEDFITELSNLETNDLNVQDILFDYENDASKLPAVYPISSDLSDLYYASKSYALKYLLKAKFWDKIRSMLDLTLRKCKPFTIQTDNFEARIKIISFGPTEMNRMLKFVKLKKTTLTPYFTAICLQTIQDVLISQFSKKKHKLSAFIAINGRRFVNDERLRYGLFISGLDIKENPIPSSSKTFSEIAKPVRHCTDSLKEELDSKDSFKMIGLLDHVRIWEFLEESSDSQKTLEYSNLGFKNIQFGDIKVTEMWFSQSLIPTVHMDVSMISTESGMHICASYNSQFDIIDPKTNTKSIDKFANTLKERLLDYTIK